MNGGLPAMRLSCMHCNKTIKTFYEDELSTFLHKDDGVYFFCSITCKDEWAYPITPKKDHDNSQHTSI